MKWLTLTLSVLLLKMTISSDVEMEEAVDNEASPIETKFASMKMGSPRPRVTLVGSQIEEVLKLWRKEAAKNKFKKLKKKLQKKSLLKQIFPGSRNLKHPHLKPKQEVPRFNTNIQKSKSINSGSLKAKAPAPVHKPATPGVKGEKSVVNSAHRETKHLTDQSTKKLSASSKDKKSATASKHSETKEEISLRKDKNKQREKKKPPKSKKEIKEKKAEKSKYKPKIPLYRKSARLPAKKKGYKAKSHKKLEPEEEVPIPGLGEGI